MSIKELSLVSNGMYSTSVAISEMQKESADASDGFMEISLGNIASRFLYWLLLHEKEVTSMIILT